MSARSLAQTVASPNPHAQKCPLLPLFDPIDPSIWTKNIDPSSWTNNKDWTSKEYDIDIDRESSDSFRWRMYRYDGKPGATGRCATLEDCCEQSLRAAAGNQQLDQLRQKAVMRALAKPAGTN
jgi:hypothetical protein